MSEVELFSCKKDCCACGACMNICPKDAISMVEDEYGFLYPHIDKSKCINCGACKKVCSYQNGEVVNEPIKTYVAVNKDMNQKMKSASGGIFAAFATKVLEEGGVVFGSALDKIDGVFVPHTIAVERKEDLCKLQGSKYVHSSTELTYKAVLKYLNLGRRVLYSGTPCQIAGLYGYLKKEYTNLLTIDLICHGVPSARLFNDYIKNEEEKRWARITNYVFRDKKRGWGMNAKMELFLANGAKKNIYIPARLASYNTLFLDGLTYRENCYSCKYACNKRPGDITIGDFWGVTDEHPEILGKNGFVEKDGISCIVVNTNKGKNACDEMSSYIEYKISSFDKVAKKNGQLVSPSCHNEKREKVMDIYRYEGYAGIEKMFKEKYRKQRIIHFVFNKMPRNLRTYVKKIIN